MKELFTIPAGRFAGEEVYYQYEEEPAKRNRFVTFWLWLGIIGSICSFGLGYFEYSQFEVLSNRCNYYGFYELESQISSISTTLLWTAIIGAVCNLIGYINLLAWRKRGFVIIVVASIILSCINIYTISQLADAINSLGAMYFDSSEIYITQVAGSFISWIILWAVLQLKRNGVSCWSQLY